jgi:hypothetical protein
MNLFIESLLSLLLFFVLGVGLGWILWARK